MTKIEGRHFGDCHEAAVIERGADGMHGVRAHDLGPESPSAPEDVSPALLAGT